MAVKKRCAVKYRIGNGYDVHRLENDRKLILGGVLIPFDKGLAGHSDADVLLHAIIDSLLGAAALGDIGRLFPDTDEAYNGISSIELLKKAYALIGSKGFKIENIDSIIIAQSPKLSPYIDSMRKNISKAVSVEPSKISVKATTEEFLGFTGEGRGIAAHAVCILSYFSFY